MKRVESVISQVVLLVALILLGGLILGVILSLLNRSGGEAGVAGSGSSLNVAVRRSVARERPGGDGAHIPASRASYGNSAVVDSSYIHARAGGDALTQSASQEQRQQPTSRDSASFAFECDSAFRVNDSHDAIARRYSPENVTIGAVYVGEGFSERGTILFANDPLRRAEISWKDTVALRNPRIVYVNGDSGRTYWRTTDGITIGSDLRSIERLNGEPFALSGFGWDYAGTVISWRDGKLAHYVRPSCEVLMRLNTAPGADSRLRQRVLGDMRFLSDNLEMQALNPRVYQLFIYFKDP